MNTRCYNFIQTLFTTSRHAALGGVMVALFLLNTSSAMAAECKPVRGRFIEQVLVPTGPDCNSPVGFCVSGRAIGVLKGDFLATVTNFIPSQDTPVTGVVFITADLVLQTRDGELWMKEAAASNQTPGEHGDLGDVVTIVGGTGAWAGATGRLLVWGNLTVSESNVRYDGNACRQ